MRDLSKQQYEYRMKKMGFAPVGFLGYWKLPAPLTVNVSDLNAGERYRDKLRYMRAKWKQETEKIKHG